MQNDSCFGEMLQSQPEPTAANVLGVLKDVWVPHADFGQLASQLGVIWGNFYKLKFVYRRNLGHALD